MNELDLTDPLVREMADRNHRPEEMWAADGVLISVHCETCGNGWPCPTRQRLTEGRDPEYAHLVSVLRYIATSCSHTPSLTEGDHIHEPTTGGERYCAPCHAWRTLNGSPDALEGDDQ